jgi:hypothetical protein
VIHSTALTKGQVEETMKLRIAIIAAIAGMLALTALAHAGEPISGIAVGLEGDCSGNDDVGCAQKMNRAKTGRALQKNPAASTTTVKSSKSNTSDRMGGGGGTKGAGGALADPPRGQQPVDLPGRR